MDWQKTEQPDEEKIPILNKCIFDKNKDSAGDSELTHTDIWDDSLLIQHYDETMNVARTKLAIKVSCSGSSLTDSDCSNSHRTELVNGYPHGKGHTAGAYSSSKKKKKKKGRKKNEWHTGDRCRARYSEDGQIYEATIIDINNATANCTVRYLGYNNQEQIAQSSLLKSKGEGARKTQLKEVTEAFDQSDETTEESCAADSDVGAENSKKTVHHTRTASHMPPPQLPLPSMPSTSQPHFPHIPDIPPPPALGLVEGADPSCSDALHTMLMSWYMTGYHTGYYQGLNQGRNYSISKNLPTHPHNKKGKNNHS